MRSQHTGLKDHYEKQKKILNEFRNKHLAIAKNDVVTAENQFQVIDQKIKTSGPTPELESQLTNAGLEQNLKFRTNLSQTVSTKRNFTITTKTGENELTKTKTEIIDRRSEEKTARKPIEERTIENMTVYFRKRNDCDYKILDKFKVEKNIMTIK